MNCPYCSLELKETRNTSVYETFTSPDEVCLTYSCSSKDNHEFFYKHTADPSHELFGFSVDTYAVGCFEGTCYFSIGSYGMIIERISACEVVEVMNKYIKLKAFL